MFILQFLKPEPAYREVRRFNFILHRTHQTAGNLKPCNNFFGTPYCWNEERVQLHLAHRRECLQVTHIRGMGRPVRRAKCAQPGHMYTCPTQMDIYSEAQWVKLSIFVVKRHLPQQVILTTPTVRKYTLTPNCSFCNNRNRCWGIARGVEQPLYCA